MYGAVYMLEKDGAYRQCLPSIPLGLPCAEDVLSNREAFQSIQEKYAHAAYAAPVAAAKRDVQMKDLLVRYGISAAKALEEVLSRQSHAKRGAKWLYRRLPERVRAKVKKGITGE
jgi:hypothetical protein